RKAMLVAACVITSCVGQEDVYLVMSDDQFKGLRANKQTRLHKRHQLVLAWSGFDQVFHNEDFWKEMMRYRDAREVLSPVIQRAEQVTSRTWKTLSATNSCGVSCQRLCEMMPGFISLAADKIPQAL